MSSSATKNNLDDASNGASDELVRRGRNEEEKEEVFLQEDEGGEDDGDSRGEQGAEAGEGAEDAKTETEDLVAAEAEKWVGGVAVDRVRSRSSMYRSEEGFQSHPQPRSRAASSAIVTKTAGADGQEKGKMGVEGGKEVPPELVVAEDQEVSLGKWNTEFIFALEYLRCNRVS